MYYKSAEGWVNLASFRVCSNHNSLEGVFRDTSPTLARMQATAHANHYSASVNKYLDGGYSGSGTQRYNEMWRDISGHKLYGAYGEEL